MGECPSTEQCQFNRDTFARMINRVESLYEKETIGSGGGGGGGGRIEASGQTNKHWERSRFIVMHPRYCVSKTLYVYPSAGGVHTGAACSEFKGGESISSRVKETWTEGSGIEEQKKRRRKRNWDETRATVEINSVDYLDPCREGEISSRSFLRTIQFS